MREDFSEVLAPDLVNVPRYMMSQTLTLKLPTRPLALGTLYAHTKIVYGLVLSAKSQVEVPETEALGSGSLLNEGLNMAIWNKSRL